jgi:hypothetical protein
MITDQSLNDRYQINKAISLNWEACPHLAAGSTSSGPTTLLTDLTVDTDTLDSQVHLLLCSNND